MRVYLDDVRIPRNPENWRIVRTAEEALSLVRTGLVSYISFDHDLGTELTGYDVAKEIEELVFAGKINCPQWNIHSANPVGARAIKAAMESAEEEFTYRNMVR